MIRGDQESPKVASECPEKRAEIIDLFTDTAAVLN